MRRAPLLLVVACAGELPSDQPCIEVGTAIGARTEACTGDADLAVARMEAFEAGYACVVEEQVEEATDPELQADLYECALVLRNLACELVDDYGDDLDLWLGSSPVCALILEPA